MHCTSNDRHKYLESKFQSTQFDYLFASDVGTIDEDKAQAKKAITGGSLVPSQKF